VKTKVLVMTKVEMKTAVRKAQLIKIRERKSVETIELWWGIADHQSAICHHVVAHFSWWCL